MTPPPVLAESQWRAMVQSNLVCVECYLDSTFGPDNRMIQDDGKAQELTEGDISIMKGEGVSGQVGVCMRGVAWADRLGCGMSGVPTQWLALQALFLAGLSTKVVIKFVSAWLRELCLAGNCVVHDWTQQLLQGQDKVFSGEVHKEERKEVCDFVFVLLL